MQLVTDEPGSGLSITCAVGVSAVTVGKALDAGTTFLGLSQYERVEELNPVAVEMIRTLGLGPGLLCVSLVSVLVVTAITEGSVRVCSTSPVVSTRLRLLGYGLATLTSVLAATHNGMVLVRLWL